MKPTINETKTKMESIVEDARRKLASVRTGRASVNLLDNIVVDYYGTPTPLNQIAAINAPEAALLTIQPWDQSALGAIEKAIQSSDLGINPSNDGKIIRIPIPPLTEERRKQLAKVVNEMAEEHKTAVRNVRRDANDRLKKMLKDKELSEDDEKKALDEIQKLTDSYIGKIADLAKHKETELMKV
ncbi:MAG TPA: ribosome recycling factor [Blastocatellia bacterium]|nr:ribosome recycling factor [Blastocatellia bacterium]